VRAMHLGQVLRNSVPFLCALGVSWFLGGAAFGLSTGTLASFTIDPATVRQTDKETTRVAATILLQTPSPTFFICELRSPDPRKISFASIIFKKGETKGQSQGVVQWKSVLKVSRLRIIAYSTDAPDRQISFTVVLKPNTVEETDDSPSQ
jgi:hypothetical protein